MMSSRWDTSLLIIGIIFQLSCTMSNADGTGPTMYDHYGTDWTGLCKTGKLQSPIAIDTNSALDIYGWFPIVFVNYAQCELRGEAGATTLVLQKINNGLVVGVAAGGLRGFYRLDSAHFHWKAEHIVDKKRPVLELHLVHYKDIYQGVPEAKKHPEGLAVIAVLYKLGKPDQGIAKMIKSFENQGNLTTADELLPNDINEYFRYYGSLTTPDCEESVIWTVLKTQKTISEDQLNWFKTLPLKDGFPIEHNFRAIQKTRGRNVYHVFAPYVY